MRKFFDRDSDSIETYANIEMLMARNADAAIKTVKRFNAVDLMEMIGLNDYVTE